MANQPSPRRWRRLGGRSIAVAPSSTFGENTIAGIIEQNGQGPNIIINLLAVMAVVIALGRTNSALLWLTFIAGKIEKVTS